ncbi:peptidase MA family metallohydrolase [Pedobacter sp.]|uniref:peptidase MA family metallohydrolase n=1 Tax=Pedobacter sp. TaxID=1411316 RepID=UPI003D7FA157
MRYLLVLLLLSINSTLYGQKSLIKLLENKQFHWTKDSSSKQVIIYYQPDSWTSRRVDSVRQKILLSIDEVKKFVGIAEYKPRIHYFIVENRIQMKSLVGYQTNGSAIAKYNIITGVISSNTKILFSNHELFHVIAMNCWGTPSAWINEGMAVYSDNKWHGYDLYQLTKYLLDNNRYVSLNILIRKFRKCDDLLAYPLMGSFIKYLDDTYGRSTLLEIWKGNSKSLQRITGKDISELEQAWLAKVKTVSYMDIKY